MTNFRTIPARMAATRAFTIVEVLVVVVILVLLATTMVPRLFTNDLRIYQATCEETADLLMMFAQRDALTQQPVGLFYNEDQRRIEVLLYDIDIESNDGKPTWRADRFIRPVQLPEFVELIDVLEDHTPTDIRQWPLASRPGQQRPWIEIVLGGPDDVVTSVSLAPYDLSPMVYVHDDQPPMIASPIDLNATGRMREDW